MQSILILLNLWVALRRRSKKAQRASRTTPATSIDQENFRTEGFHNAYTTSYTRLLDQGSEENVSSGGVSRGATRQGTSFQKVHNASGPNPVNVNGVARIGFGSSTANNIRQPSPTSVTGQ